MTKKIVHISSAHSALDIRIFEKECKSLFKAGFDITLIIPNNGNNERVNGVKIKSIGSTNSRLKRMVVRTYQAYRKALREDADLYHIHDPELIPFGVRLAQKGNKVVYDIHENISSQILGKTWIKPIFRSGIGKVYKFVENILLSRFNGIVVTDEVLYDAYSKFTNHIEIINNYPNLKEFGKDIDMSISRYNKSTVINLGGIRQGRVTTEIIDSLNLCEPDDDICMIVGGRVASKDLLKKSRTKIGWEKVRYEGLVSRSRMLDLMSESSIAIVLYSYGPNHMEIRSNRLFESMAAGLPVIVPDFPKWKEFIKENECGINVDPHKPVQIKEAMMYLLDYPEDAARMGKNGFQAVHKKYSWASQEKKLFTLYEKIFE
jgi:glycosyltransferase involved in cell wall biosynthesis